jgi:hypothetical protein
MHLYHNGQQAAGSGHRHPSGLIGHDGLLDCCGIANKKLLFLWLIRKKEVYLHAKRKSENDSKTIAYDTKRNNPFMCSATGDRSRECHGQRRAVA